MAFKVFQEIDRRGHEQVTVFNYPKAGLKAIVAIHNTVLGPALGGCRMRMYPDEESALDDALRLAEGMTYKSSIAGLNLGGGKSVIIADPKLSSGRRELFLQFAKCLNDLCGRYITAEDMGTSADDMLVIREVSKFAAGFPIEKGGSGDPSPWTAKGVFFGIQAACKKRYGSDDLSGRHVAIQGVGHVGRYLLEQLVKAGAKVTVCDSNDQIVKQVVEDFKVQAVSLDGIYDVKCDIFSPCAVGQTVNRDTLMRLRCEIIAGAANNQLIDSSVYTLITQRGIMYCPDFAINAGGIISVGAEYNPGGWKEEWVAKKVADIGPTVARILEESEKRKRFTEVVALELARERLGSAHGTLASSPA